VFIPFLGKDLLAKIEREAEEQIGGLQKMVSKPRESKL